ncbi:hypothetical protein TNCV_4664131 [Trichonephila clavipes]|nr:hypothetical protein TNCV_4664131 [Trichonephila clavipes]
MHMKCPSGFFPLICSNASVQPIECLLSQCVCVRAIDQPQQCHSDNSGLSRRNRIQEKLRFCSHAFLPRSTNQSGHSLPGRPTHIRPHTQSRYGMEERFAFRFPETPSIIINALLAKICSVFIEEP